MPVKYKKPYKFIDFRFRKRRLQVFADRVLVFRYLREMRGRFWGITGISIMIIGFSICFLIRPDLLVPSTAFSDFGNDVRTAPYFAGSVFVAAYGLWRWRNYLGRTLKYAKPIYGLTTLTVLGLYIVALMPIGWEPLPRRIHIFGVALAGFSMLATVVADGLLSKTPKSRHQFRWRMIRITAFTMIVAGGWITFGSLKEIGWYNMALIGETLMLAGYTIWVGFKTYQSEGRRTTIARLLKRVHVLVN